MDRNDSGSNFFPITDLDYCTNGARDIEARGLIAAGMSDDEVVVECAREAQQHGYEWTPLTVEDVQALRNSAGT